MLYKNLKVRELYPTMEHDMVMLLLREGLKSQNDRLAGSAAEELIRRGYGETVKEEIKKALRGGDMKQGTAFVSMMGAMLSENSREIGPFDEEISGRFGEYINVSRAAKLVRAAGFKNMERDMFTGMSMARKGTYDHPESPSDIDDATGLASQDDSDVFANMAEAATSARHAGRESKKTMAKQYLADLTPKQSERLKSDARRILHDIL